MTPQRAIHHWDLWVTDPAVAADEWGWLFGELGWAVDGASWMADDGTYVFLVECLPDQVDAPYDRMRPGVNHLAFTVEDRPLLDRIRRLRAPTAGTSCSPTATRTPAGTSTRRSTWRTPRGSRSSWWWGTEVPSDGRRRHQGAGMRGQPDTGLDLDRLADEVDGRLEAADAALARAHPGERPGRQPVHTVYVPADRFHAAPRPREYGAEALRPR